MCACPCPCPQGVSMYVRRAMREKTFVQWAVPAVGSGQSPLIVCVREMQSHGQNGYMEPFTFTDTDTDTRTWGHPMSMTGDQKMFTDVDTDTDTRTCRHSFTAKMNIAPPAHLLCVLDYFAAFHIAPLLVFQRRHRSQIHRGVSCASAPQLPEGDWPPSPQLCGAGHAVRHGVLRTW